MDSYHAARLEEQAKENGPEALVALIVTAILLAIAVALDSIGSDRILSMLVQILGTAGVIAGLITFLVGITWLYGSWDRWLARLLTRW